MTVYNLVWVISAPLSLCVILGKKYDSSNNSRNINNNSNNSL